MPGSPPAGHGDHERRKTVPGPSPETSPGTAWSRGHNPPPVPKPPCPVKLCGVVALGMLRAGGAEHAVWQLRSEHLLAAPWCLNAREIAGTAIICHDSQAR